ncbi:hypothetical protein MBLNU457_7172t1 [Dothideomycetes sp. NU457]
MASLKRKHDDIEDEPTTTAEPKVEEGEEIVVVRDEAEVSDHDEDVEDDEDGEGSEEGLEPIPAYAANMEPFPDHPAYDQSTGQIYATLLRLLNQVDQLTDGESSEKTDIKPIKDDVSRTRAMLDRAPFKIALAGNIGAGKSSLVNALLNIPGIAKNVVIGQSCTAVATEYQKAFPNQQSKYQAVVRYRHGSEIEEFLAPKIQANLIFHFKTSPEDEAEDPESYDELRLQAQTCEKVLLALFATMPDFRTPAEIKNTLRKCFTTLEECQPVLLAIFVRWCEEMMQAIGADDTGRHCNHFEAPSVKALHNNLDPYISASDAFAGAPQLWPLVKNVAVGIKDIKILHYVTLVDLPGLSDTCQVRANACFDALRECDALWIVDDIERIVASWRVHSLRQRYRDRFARSITIVGTCIDVVQSMEGVIDLLSKEGYDMANLTDLYKRYTKNERTKEKLERISLRQRLSDKQQDDLRRLQASCGLLGRRVFAEVVALRNDSLRKQLTKKHGQLPIFFVSSEHYEIVSQRVLRTQKTLLSITESGIPDLRSYALSSVADSIWEHLAQCIQGPYKRFLIGLSMWANIKPTHVPETLEKHSRDLQKDFTGAVAKLRKNLKDDIENQLRLPLGGRVQSFSKKMETLPDKCSSWHVSALQAFVRRKGKSGGTMKQKGNWNKELLKVVKVDFDNAWKNMLSSAGTNTGPFKKEIDCLVEKLISLVRESPVLFGIDEQRTKALAEAIKSSIHLQITGFRLKHHVENLNIAIAALDDLDSNHMVRALNATLYWPSKLDSGAGWRARFCDRFKALLNPGCDRNPFRQWVDGTSADVDRNNATRTAKLETALKEAGIDIIDQFRRLSIANNVNNPAGYRTRKQVRDFLPEAQAMFADVNATMARLKRSYQKGPSSSTSPFEVPLRLVQAEEPEEKQQRNPMQRLIAFWR